jgi:3-hydroxy-3-methylglutaryl CoA synthase/uncharacterized OB-fold protein
MNGIVAYGSYLPYFRLDRKSIGDALAGGGGKGTRTVASYDEDTTSMGVEAARAALRGAPGVAPAAIYFATADPAYLDKTNATAIHAALSLDDSAMAFDMLGSIRSGAGVLRAAADAGRPTLAVIADIRTGLPGGGDERDGGDAAVAFLLAPGDAQAPVIAEHVASASASAEFLERWRIPGDPASRQWEERFGEHAYVPLADAAITSALEKAGATAGELAALIVAGPHGRANKRAQAAVGAKPEAIADDLTGTVGNTGAAHAGLLLADALDRAKAGDLIAVVSLADGCDVTIWRATAALATHRQKVPVAKQAAAGGKVAYATFLTWRGFLKREPPRRPEPDRPAGPPSLRTNAWKYGLVGSRDENGFVHLPPSRVSMGSGEIDHMEEVRMADVPATVATFTVDRLAYSLSPPVVAAILDFDGGGRFQCELTDVDPASVAIGDRVTMTFRRLYTSGGVHNYFWKARPLSEES